jgi:hypothetical protein
MSVRLIDFNRLAVYEAGALLVTLLAFPDASDETQGNVQASLCNYALRIRSAIEPDWTILPKPIKPFYAFRSERDCNRELRTLERRWRDRIVAGRMGIAFLKEALPGQVLELPPTVKRHSINQLAELVLDDESGDLGHRARHHRLLRLSRAASNPRTRGMAQRGRSRPRRRDRHPHLPQLQLEFPTAQRCGTPHFFEKRGINTSIGRSAGTRSRGAFCAAPMSGDFTPGISILKPARPTTGRARGPDECDPRNPSTELIPCQPLHTGGLKASNFRPPGCNGNRRSDRALGQRRRGPSG